MESHRNTVAAPHRTHARGLLRRNKCRRPRSDHTKAALWELYAASPASGADRDAEQHAYPEHQLGHGWGKLTSATGYNVFNYDIHADYTGYYGQDAPLYGLTSDTFAVDGFQRSRTERTVEELRLASKPGGKLDWQIGGYYDLENSYFHYHATPYQLPEQQQIDAPDVSISINPSQYRDTAVFGNIDYHFTSTVDLLLGARESWNHQYFASQQTRISTGVGPAQEGTSSDKAFTFLVSPRWNVSNSLMTYARIASGYRAGGPNLLPPDAPADVPQTYKPDSIISYEVGAKKEWADLSHLVLNVDVFHIDWKDIQMYTTVDGLGAAINASKAHVNGAQLSLSALPLQGLTLALNVGYQNARLGADTPAIGGLNGDRLPSVPEFTGALEVDYRHTLFGSTVGVFGATYRYIGDNQSDFFLQGDQFTIAAVSRLDLRAGLEFGRTNISIVAKNVTNEVGYSTISYGPTGTQRVCTATNHSWTCTFSSSFSAGRKPLRCIPVATFLWHLVAASSWHTREAGVHTAPRARRTSCSRLGSTWPETGCTFSSIRWRRNF